MSKGALLFAGLVLLAGLAACDKSASHAVAASSFPDTCEQSGQLGCCNLDCANTAIRLDAYTQYGKGVGARFPLCVPEPSCVPLPPCSAGRLGCVNGTCELLFAAP